MGRIEREYLDVLNFELKITEDDLLSHHHGLSEVVSDLTHSPSAMSVSAPQHLHSERRHRRRETGAPAPGMKVPELSPSGAASSESDSDSSFSSPRTPSESSSMDTSPEEAPRNTLRPSKASFHQAPAAHVHHAAPNPTTARKMMNAVKQSTMSDMLRMFPIPRMTTS